MRAFITLALLLSLLNLCTAKIGGLAKLGGKLAKDGIETASDINDHVQNNNRRAMAVPFGDKPASSNQYDHEQLGGYIYARDDEDPFAGLPEPAVSQCKGQLKGTTIKYRVINNKSVRFDNVPSTCMTLANVFLGKNPGGAAPIPMGEFLLSRTLYLILWMLTRLGNASLRYDNVSQQQIKELRDAFGNKKE